MAVTRNAVIGKLHRPWARRPRQGHGSQPLRPQPQSKATRHYKHKPVPVPVPVPAPWRIKQPSICDLPPETVENPIGFVELAEHHCRWPVDGAGYQTLFCGADSVEKLSYCPRHCHMAYHAPEPRRRPRGASRMTAKAWDRFQPFHTKRNKNAAISRIKHFHKLPERRRWIGAYDRLDCFGKLLGT